MNNKNNDQKISIATYIESGFERITEAESPIIFNVSKPVYLKKGDNFIVVDVNGCCDSWDHSNVVSRNRIIEGREDAIVNPGSDLLDDDVYLNDNDVDDLKDYNWPDE